MVDQLRWTTIEHAVRFFPSAGYITCRTDRPVTLTMQWSTIPWRMHMHAELKRGRLFLAWPYYCFVQYTLQDQREEGDTMSHTFILPGWPILEYRVWHFNGTVAGRPSPSSSPLFSTTRQPTPAAAPIAAYPILHLHLKPILAAPIHRSATPVTTTIPYPMAAQLFSELSPWHQAEAAISAASATTPAPTPPPVKASFEVVQSPWHIEPAPIKASYTGVVT